MLKPARQSIGLVVLLLVGLGAAALVVLIGGLLEARMHERWRAERLSDLSGVRARLEGSLNGALNITAGLIAEIAARGDISREEFERHARELLVERGLIRNISLAPGNVVSMVYPRAGNEAAIGLDLLAHPVQGAATRAILATRKPLLAGPVNLVQGGWAVIHRVPIFLSPPGQAPRSGDYWGLMSTPIDFDGLLSESGLLDPQLPFRIALRGVDGRGAAGDVFWGEPTVFSDPAAFLLDVQVLGGSWRMAAVPLGAPDHAASAWAARGAGLLLALLTVAMVWHLHDLHRRLAESERFHRELAEQMHDVIFQTDGDGRVRYLSPAWTRITGQPVEAGLGLSLTDLLAPARGPGGEAAGRAGRYRIADAAGAPRDLVLHANGPLAKGGLTGILVDVTERRELEERLEVAGRMFERSGEGIVVFDGDGRIQSVNPAFRVITGFAEDDAVEQGAGLFLAGEELDIEARLRDRDFWQGEMDGLRKSGAVYPLTLSLTAVRDDAAALTHAIAIFSDISERRAQARRVEYLALHDSLTGLPNRVLMATRFEQAAELARREGHAMALLYFDLDGFKPLNDCHGHEVGDHMLRHVAGQIRQVLRRSDTAARVGGDEFVILLARIASPHDAETVAAKLMEALKTPLMVGGQPLTVGVSIGIALHPRHGDTLEALMRTADFAMYEVKARRGGGWAMAPAS